MRYPTFKTTVDTLATDVKLFLTANEMADNMIETMDIYSWERFKLPDIGYGVYETMAGYEYSVSDDVNRVFWARLTFVIVRTGSDFTMAPRSIGWDNYESLKTMDCDVISAKFDYCKSPTLFINIYNRNYSHQSLLRFLLGNIMKCPEEDVNEIASMLHGSVNIPYISGGAVQTYVVLDTNKRGRLDIMKKYTAR